MTFARDPVSATWYESAFDRLYPIVYAHRSVETAAAETRFAAEQVELKHGESALDLCCGNGRHLVHLLEYTPLVFGLDFSRSLLTAAKEALGGTVGLVRADMRAIPFRAAFDVALNFFTSFGYFVAKEENLAVVANLANALKRGGRFFIDYFNCDYAEHTLVPRSQRYHQGYEIREERWLDAATNRINKISVVLKSGRVVGSAQESLQLYRADEFLELLREGGLHVDRLFGNYSGAPLAADQPRMIAVGHRT